MYKKARNLSMLLGAKVWLFDAVAFILAWEDLSPLEAEAKIQRSFQEDSLFPYLISFKKTSCCPTWLE